MDRRLFLSIIAGTAVIPQLVKAVPLAPPQPYRLNLANQHTGETFSGIYRDDKGPIPAAMDDLSAFLRDYHCDEKIAIDVGVVDFLSHVMQRVGQRSATIFSAYRTPETNEKLTHGGFGAAENSQHLYGRALDVHFGEKLEDAMHAARGMQRGGVGWYPHSGFMHIDTGPVRNWDLNHKGLGTLLIAGHHVQFNKQGDVLADKKRLVGGRFPHLVSDNSVRGRLTRLRQVARAEFVGRHH
ncbi:MAG: YcbK family protein [Alphaproteobacteria bacterium]|nr:YcbK family protein [Alphaproteobacteria bacterium]